MRYVLPLTMALVLVPATAARADLEYWGTAELRVPLLARAPLTGQPVQWRTVSDLRYGLRYPGLGWDFLRFGPLWHVAPGWFVGTHLTTVAVQTAPGVLTQEYRAEFEPNWGARFGDWLIADRNRLEYRWRANDQHFRYRNMVRVAYAPPGNAWIPFAWEEVMVELNADGLAQNRLQVGLGRQLTEDVRLDVGAMLRSRATAAGWEHDYILNTFIYVAPVHMAPLFGAAAGGE